MRVGAVLNSLTFRYIAKYVTALSATVFLLLGVLYGYFSHGYLSDLRESIVEELETLQLVYRGEGLDGTKRYLEEQRNLPSMGRYSYLIVDAAGNKVAGDLASTPRYREFSGGWLGFQLALLNWGQPVDVDFLARAEPLDGTYTAIVARNYADAVAAVRLVFNTLFRAMFATLLLGMIGGFFSAASTLDHFEKLNTELARVVKGDVAGRLSVENRKGYSRELATAMNQMLDQMATLMQGVKQMSDNIAHDLRTPLTRIRNHLAQLRTRLDATGQGDIDRIIEECDALLSSFHALLRISALEAGRRVPADSRVSLAAIVDDVAELYEPLANDKGIALQLEVQQGPDCPGDSDLLFQMCANLLDNAIKYTPPGGSILLALQYRGGTGYQLVVADSGPGIDGSEREHVFQRFYRIGSSRGEHPGHGLGLSLVQAIVHFHRGSIALADNAPGLRVEVRLSAPPA